MDRPHLRIAIIDDDESVRKALGRLLRAEDLDADTFSSAEEFLSSLASARPDCIILDVQMPGMNGLALLRRLAEEDPPLPAVVITGHEEPHARTQCLSAGATAYLRKPLDVEALLSAIYGAVDTQRCDGKPTVIGEGPHLF